MLVHVPFPAATSAYRREKGSALSSGVIKATSALGIVHTSLPTVVFC